MATLRFISLANMQTLDIVLIDFRKKILSDIDKNGIWH